MGAQSKLTRLAGPVVSAVHAASSARRAAAAASAFSLRVANTQQTAGFAAEAAARNQPSFGARRAANNGSSSSSALRVASTRSMASVAEHHGHNTSLQAAVHKMSLEDPEQFWGAAALDIKWFKFPKKIFSGEGDGAKDVSSIKVKLRIWES